MATSPGRRKGDDRIFNPHGFKHYRRRYSRVELRWGLVILLILFGIGGWVAYRGAHPPADLFNDGTKLLAKSKIRVVVRPTKRLNVRAMRSPRRQGALQHPLLPMSIAGKGWRRRPISRFSAKNLYVKINGRAGYFKSFGFRMLYFTTLFHKESRQLIDVEMYDMGTAANALGTYTGELSRKSRPEVDAQGLSHISRNALFISRGRYYLRVIGSDEKPVVIEKLKSLRTFFFGKIKGKPLPWAYGLLIANMGVKISDISYVRENALGFGFAKDVFKAKWGNAYLFLCARTNEKEASAMAAAFRKGFLSYGNKLPTTKEAQWIKDKYIGTYATAKAVERWVVGVQGAEKLPAARKRFAAFVKAIKSMSPTLRKRAMPTKLPSKRPAPRRAVVPREGSYGEPTGRKVPSVEPRAPRGRPPGEPRYGEPRDRGPGEPRYGEPRGRPPGEPRYDAPVKRHQPAKRGVAEGGYGAPPARRRATSRPAPRRVPPSSTPTHRRTRPRPKQPNRGGVYER